MYGYQERYGYQKLEHACGNQTRQLPDLVWPPEAEACGRGRATGGAINLNSAVNVTVLSSVFVGNEAQNGGGVCVKECVRSTFFDNSFTSNWADTSGGGLFQLKCSGAACLRKVAAAAEQVPCTS